MNIKREIHIKRYNEKGKERKIKRERRDKDKKR
jgi:hypothetical protein